MKTIVRINVDGQLKEFYCDFLRVDKETKCLELYFNNKDLFVELVEFSTTHKLNLEVKPIGMILIAPYDALESIMH